MPLLDALNWKWENATAGAVAGFSTVAILHPLDVVRTRFQGLLPSSFSSTPFFFFFFFLLDVEIQLLIVFGFAVNDGRLANLPSYKNTGHAIYTIARTEVGCLSLVFIFSLIYFRDFSDWICWYWR